MSTATDMLQKYIDAEAAVLLGHSVTIGGRTLTRANLVEIQAGRREWQIKVDAEARKSANQQGYAVADFSRCRR